MNAPILCLDFDGVIHAYSSKWVAIDFIPDPPVEGAFEFIIQAQYHFKVCIYSSRSKEAKGIRAMRDWFLRHGLPQYALDALDFPSQKPPAFLTIDDRALTFEGVFPDPKALREFKPWNRRD